MPQIFPEKSPRFILVLLVAILAIFIAFTLGLTLSSNKSNPQPKQNQPSPKNQVSGAKAIPQSTPSPDSREKVKVTRVVDGDTIEIEGGQKVRYIGIDTPEVVDPRKPVECFGKEAATKNRQLVEGKIVELEKDITETDKYGRLLRYVYLPSEASAKEGGGDLFINDYLIRQGYANASSYPPDVKYQDQFRQAEQEAQENARGLWGQCVKGQQTSVSSQSVSDSDSGCQIKGNISSTGEKIYHLPGQRYYDKTVIDENKGERWFCSEEEAISAGWRKAKI